MIGSHSVRRPPSRCSGVTEGGGKGIREGSGNGRGLVMWTLLVHKRKIRNPLTLDNPVLCSDVPPYPERFERSARSLCDLKVRLYSLLC